jgi:hypothetical protein
MKIHINYAHGAFLEAQRLCCETAISRGGFDVSIPYGIDDLDPNFKQQNSYILSQPRGAGYWIWKPYLILRHLHEMKEGDWLMYTDSGMHFCDNPWNWILPEESEMGDKGIMTFGTYSTNATWTKRDTFVLMNMDNESVKNMPQRLASSFVCKKTPFSISFVGEWLRYAQDPRIVTDLPNTQSLPNYPEFRDHRHDQSILSLLTIKHNTHVYTKKDITNHNNKEDPCMICHGLSNPQLIAQERSKHVGNERPLVCYMSKNKFSEMKIQGEAK